MNISYKPQTIAPKFEGTVRELFYNKIGGNWETPTFISEVTRPLKL
jgi:ATP-binding cassette subfamily E protein 1